MAATWIVASTRIGVTLFGRTCLRMVVQSLAPMLRAALT